MTWYLSMGFGPKTRAIMNKVETNRDREAYCKKRKGKKGKKRRKFRYERRGSNHVVKIEIKPRTLGLCRHLNSQSPKFLIFQNEFPYLTFFHLWQLYPLNLYYVMAQLLTPAKKSLLLPSLTHIILTLNLSGMVTFSCPLRVQVATRINSLIFLWNYSTQSYS